MQRNFESPHFSAMQLGDETMMQLCIQGLAHLLGCHGKILSNLYYILATLDPMARFLLRSYQDVSISQVRILLTERILRFHNFDEAFQEWSHLYDHSFAGSFLAIFTQLLSLDLVFGRENKILINKIYRKKIYKIDILSKGIRSKLCVYVMYICIERRSA